MEKRNFNLQVCDADDSHCTCMVNGKPVRVTLPPQPLTGDGVENDLIAGILGKCIKGLTTYRSLNQLL